LVTSTPTATIGQGSGKPILYPNPADGTTPVGLLFNLDSSADMVKIQLFTTAFRKILEKPLGSAQAGPQQTSFELKDNRGTPLASGVYYVVISAGSQRLVGKLLILR
jgi:hypothetical protein